VNGVALAPEQARTLDTLAALFTSHRSVLIGALAIQCQAPMQRLTADVDVAIVTSGAFVAESLRAAGWVQDASMAHRWRRQRELVDIIQLTEEDLLAGVVELDGAVLSLVGFDLAFSEGNVTRVTPATEVMVPPLPVLVLLKMIAWMDRPHDRVKDLADIVHVWDNSLSDDDRWAEPSPWLDAEIEYDDQGAFYVGWKLGQVAGPGHVHWAKRFLDHVRDEDSAAFAQFVRASRYLGDDPASTLRGRLSAFELGLQQGSLRAAVLPEPAGTQVKSVPTPAWGASGSLEQRLHDAIDSRVLVAFYYKGHRRVAEPHALGVKDGRLQVLTYQVGGTSSSGSLPNWRRFFVDELSQLQVTSQAFVPQRLTFGRHSAFDRQIALVKGHR